MPQKKMVRLIPEYAIGAVAPYVVSCPHPLPLPVPGLGVIFEQLRRQTNSPEGKQSGHETTRGQTNYMQLPRRTTVHIHFLHPGCLIFYRMNRLVQEQQSLTGGRSGLTGGGTTQTGRFGTAFFFLFLCSHVGIWDMGFSFFFVGFNLCPTLSSPVRPLCPGHGVSLACGTVLSRCGPIFAPIKPIGIDRGVRRVRIYDCEYNLQSQTPQANPTEIVRWERVPAGGAGGGAHMSYSSLR